MKPDIRDIPHIKEGPPIWVESLMSKKEWYHRRMVFGTRLHSPPEFFKSDYEWRYRMGNTPTTEEIININANLEYLRQLSKPESITL